MRHAVFGCIMRTLKRLKKMYYHDEIFPLHIYTNLMEKPINSSCISFETECIICPWATNHSKYMYNHIESEPHSYFHIQHNHWHFVMIWNKPKDLFQFRNIVVLILFPVYPSFTHYLHKIIDWILTWSSTMYFHSLI